MHVADDKADAQANGPGSQSNFGVVQERVRNLEQRLGDLASSLKETNVAVRDAARAIEQAGKTKWPILIGVSTVICVITGAVWNIAISPLAERIKVIELSYVPERVHHDRWEQEDRDRQRLEEEIRGKADGAVIDKTINKLELAIDQLNRDMGFGRKK